MTPQHSTALSVSVADAAALTSLSQHEVYSAINRGELKVRRLGRRILIRTEDLREWIDSLPATIAPADAS